jgi:hypothetical protein
MDSYDADTSNDDPYNESEPQLVMDGAYPCIAKNPEG